MINSNALLIKELEKQWIALVEEELPLNSGDKIIQVTLKLNYDPNAGDQNLRGHQYLKIVFWRPYESMIVAYNFGPKAAAIGNQFHITANHRRDWKRDGFSFFNRIIHQLKEIKVSAVNSVEGFIAEAIGGQITVMPRRGSMKPLSVISSTQ